jgi:hypothetical protein
MHKNRSTDGIVKKDTGLRFYAKHDKSTKEAIIYALYFIIQ